MSHKANREAKFVLVFLIVVILFVTTFQMGVVRGVSMEPTYLDGTVVLVRKINRFSPPLKRNDVVLVKQGRDVIIKRVFLLAGEEVDARAPDLLSATHRNQKEDYYEQQPITSDPGVKKTYRVPSNFIAVIGDNFRQSEDSRIFGPVPLHDVLGVVVGAPPPSYLPPRN